jgi:hypothetical protein
MYQIYPYGSIYAVYAAVMVVTLANVPANANIIKDTSMVALAQGFGAVPRLLTVQADQTPEFACDSNSGGSLVQTRGADVTFQGNGLANGTIGNMVM